MNLKPEELVKALLCTVSSEERRRCKICNGDIIRCNECINGYIRQSADQIERDQKEIEALREKQQWIPVAERLPEELVLVNVVWVNRVPEPYYEKIKGVPFSGTACFFEERWYWDSPIVLDLLSEYGKDDPDLVDDAVDITHWMPLPEPPKEDNHDA